MTKPCRSMIAAVLLCASLPAYAGARRWTPYGPPAWPLFDFAASSSGRLLVASGSNGVFASEDHGRTWSWSGAGMGTERVQAITADPMAPSDGYLFAMGETRLFVSRDDGKSWTAGAQTVPVGAPVETGDLLAVAGNTVFVARDTILARSTDGGATWQRVLEQPLPFTALLIDPNDERSVFAATLQGGGLLHSGDGGTSWRYVTNVEPALPPPFDTPFSFGVLELAAVSTSPATLFALMNLGLYRSTDAGASWHLLPPAPDPSVGYVYSVAVAPGPPATVYTVQQLDTQGPFAHAGIFASQDLGATWTRVDEDGGVPFGRLELDSAGGDLFVLTPSSLGRGAGGGAHWTLPLRLSENCPSPSSTSGFLRWSHDASRAWAVVSGSLFASRDRGRSWGIPGNPPFCLSDLRADPQRSTTIYATTASEVLKSRNGGATWKSLLAPPGLGGDRPFNAVAVPRPGELIAGGCGLWWSNNDGQTWKKTVGCIRQVPDLGDVVRSVKRLLVDPARPEIVYAGVTESEEQHPVFGSPFILRSTNGGRTWKRLIDGSTVIAVDPRRTTTLYVLGGGAVRRSTDDGRTWQTISHPGPGQVELDLVVDPFDSRTLYGSGPLGVFRSRDGGVTWEPFGTGLRGRTPLGLFPDPSRHALYTGAGGLFEIH